MRSNLNDPSTPHFSLPSSNFSYAFPNFHTTEASDSQVSSREWEYQGYCKAFHNRQYEYSAKSDKKMEESRILIKGAS